MTEKKILIVQTSPMHTASTFLVNSLYGFICKDKNVLFYNIDQLYDFQDSVTIIKTHTLNIDYIIELYSNNYDLYFVCSERPEYNLFIDEKYKTYKNVLVFNYSDLLETKNNTLDMIINNIYDKLLPFLPNYINLSKEDAKNRITNMNILCKRIKNKPFSYYDKFYHIHGSHRNRKHK